MYPACACSPCRTSSALSQHSLNPLSLLPSNSVSPHIHIRPTHARARTHTHTHSLTHSPNLGPAPLPPPLQVLLLEANIDQAKKAGAAQAVEVMTMLKDKAGIHSLLRPARRCPSPASVERGGRSLVGGRAAGEDTSLVLEDGWGDLCRVATLGRC
jgi:hypothetical protein